MSTIPPTGDALASSTGTGTGSELGKRPLEMDAADNASKRRTTGKKSANQERPEEGAPTQKEMPNRYEYAAAEKDQLKIVSWNICSLNASVKKGMCKYILGEKPDILCLQETKLQTAPATLAAAGLAELDYPYTYFACSTVQKGYAGTAILSRYKPESVAYGLPETDEAQCTEGRTITLEFRHFYLVACYVPNAGSQLVRLDRRQKWDRAMRQYLRRLDANKPVVWCGDLNVCHREMDIARPDNNRRSAGFTDEERVGLSNIMGVKPPADVSSQVVKQLADADATADPALAPFVDTWRQLHPHNRRYTYFSYRFNCRSKYMGWRLDYFIASRRLLERVLASEIRDEVYGASDHVPIMLLLDTKDWSMAAPSETDSETTRIVIAAGNKTIVKPAKPVNTLTSWLKKPAPAANDK